MRWEYKSFRHKGSGSFGTTASESDIDSQLTLLGKDGWELTAALPAAYAGGANLLIFKRAAADPAPAAAPQAHDRPAGVRGRQAV